MRVQRIIASVLLSVLFLTPLAPALVTQVEAAPQHCVRPRLAPAASEAQASSSPSSGMHCHEGMPRDEGMQHRMAEGTPADESQTITDHEVGSNGCCTSHDCCNSTVRSQWAQSTRNSVFTMAEPTQIMSVLPLVPPPQSAQFNLSRGRAPPNL